MISKVNLLKIKLCISICLVAVNVTGCDMLSFFSKPMPREIEQQFDTANKMKLNYLRLNFIGKDKSAIFAEMGKPKKIEKHVWFCKVAASGYAGCFYDPLKNIKKGEIEFYDEVFYYEETQKSNGWVEYSEYRFNIIKNKVDSIY